ncbi:MAG: glycan-binding surface protein [Dysgonamonadaceae bacterium]|jgi:hypothetical protein|nr:glycan-binding surface protein [Dysgonamonadaceae bacterium]
MKFNNINKILPVLLFFSSLLFTSCEEETPGKYETTDGLPTIHYIRYQDSNLAGQLLTGAYMEENILIIGENLTSVQEIWFNDVKALLNVNMITKNTLFVNVPKDLPTLETDKLYFVTGAKDTIDYDFEVKIPAPILTRIKCEQVPESSEAVLIGDYFLTPDFSLIKVFIGDYEVPTSDLVSVEKNKIVFKAPAMDIKGAIEVKTLYGSSGRSKDVFHDDRGWIMDFEGIGNKGYDWDTPSFVENDPDFALTGNYARFSGTVAADVYSNGPTDALLYYFGGNHGYGTDNLFSSDPATSTLKFEVNVLEAWTGLPMVFYFAPPVNNNDPLWDQSNQYARAFWIPWQTTGSYTTDGWETISIPLSEFKYNNAGIDIGFMGGSLQQLPNTFNNLDIYLTNFGLEKFNEKDAVGTNCDPVILIDNIRVVP